MNELLLSSEELIPDIFFTAHKFLEDVAEDFKKYCEKVTEGSTQEFYGKFNQFYTNGWKYVKTGLSDLCVGLKAFGDKLSSLGGESFINLGNITKNIVSSTGSMFNYMDNFTIQINELMQENSDNSKFEELSTTIANYLTSLSSNLKDCSTYSTHLYGDAKEVIGKNFDNLSEGLLRFIQNVKLKTTIGITTFVVGIKIAYDYFSENEETIYNVIKLVSDNTLSLESVDQLIDFILTDLTQAKVETLKAFQN